MDTQAKGPSPEEVKSYYENWTDKYVEDFGIIFQALQTQNQEELIDYIGQQLQLQDGMKVLDAGCGVGGPALLLAEHYDIDLQAITISPVQVEMAEAEKAKRSLKGSVQFEELDFHKIGERYEANSFDRIYFLESLVHSNDPKLVIEACRKVLKPEGTLYIKDLFYGPDDPANPGQTEYPVQKINEQFTLKIRKVGDIINMLTEAGFELQFCKKLDVEKDFDRGNLFTAKYLFKLLPDQDGPWIHKGLRFLHWLEISCKKEF